MCRRCSASKRRHRRPELQNGNPELEVSVARQCVGGDFSVSAAIKLSSPATKQFWEIPVLFEDAELLALDKPVGLPTEPETNAPDLPSLMKLVHAAITDGKPWAVERQLTFLSNVNRLDAETG